MIYTTKSVRFKLLGFMVCLASLVAVGVFLDIPQYLDITFLKAQKETAIAWQSAHPLRFAFLLFVGYCLATAVALPGVTVFFTLAAGAFLGVFWGTVLASFAAALGSTIGFLLARWLLNDWVEQQFPESVKRINQGVEEDGPLYLLSMRLLPVVPFFLINVVMAVSCMRAIVFYLVTQLGMLPSKMVYVNAGTQLEKIDSVSDLSSPLLIASLFVLAILPWLARLFVKRLGLKNQL